MNGISNLGNTLASDISHTLDMVKAETLENKTSSLYKSEKGTVQFKNGSFYMARFANDTKAGAGINEAKSLLNGLVENSGLPQSHIDRLKGEIEDTFTTQMGTNKKINLSDLASIKQTLVQSIRNDYAPEQEVALSASSPNADPAVSNDPEVVTIGGSEAPKPEVVTIGGDNPDVETGSDAAIATELQAHENDITNFMTNVTRGADDAAIAEQLQEHEKDLKDFIDTANQNANDAVIADELQAHEKDIKAFKDKAMQEMNDEAIAKALGHEDG